MKFRHFVYNKDTIMSIFALLYANHTIKFHAKQQKSQLPLEKCREKC